MDKISFYSESLAICDEVDYEWQLPSDAVVINKPSPKKQEYTYICVDNILSYKSFCYKVRK